MTTRTPTRRTWRFVVRCSAAAGFAALAADALAADRSWTNTAGGTFSTAANWQNSLVPGVNDVANFNNSSIFFPPGQTNYTISFAGNTQIQAVKVKNDFVTFNLLGRTFTTTQTTGNEIGTVAGGGSIAVARSARLTIQNGTFNFSGITPQMLIGAVPGGIGTLAIGADGIVTGSPNLFFGTASAAGTLTVNGGTMTVATLSLGSGASGNGTASIVGPFSSVTTTRLLVGDAGAGTMSMTIGAIFQNNGSATIGNAANSSGLVDVDGATVRWNQTGALTVGNSGAGTINVINGGSLNAAVAVLGNNSSAFGRLNVAGSNSRARFTDLTIGNTGVGSLTVSGGGSVNCTGSFTSIGNTGAAFVSITSGGVWSTDGTATLANASLSTAQVAVDGAGSRWSNSGSMTVGKLGAASLTVTNGGRIENSGTCIIADSGQAFVRVDGASSRFVTFGNLTAGRAGAASIDIVGGAFMQTHTASLGLAAGGSAIVTVDGQGSNWTLTDNGTPRSLRVATAGSATLNLTNGGDVLAADVTVGTGGTVRVEGESSRLLIASSNTITEGDLDVSGRLDIAGSGVAQSVRGYVESGTVTVSGVNSRWSIDTHLIVDGSMTVSSGARVEQGQEGSIRNGGVVSVAAGTWTTGTDLFVGGSPSVPFGSGVLNVNPSGVVSATNTLVIWDNGTVNLSGGSLRVGSIDFRGSTFNFNSGTLRMTGVVNLDAFFLDKLLGNPRTLGPNRTLIIDTTPTLSSLFILGGGILTVPQLAVGSPLQFDSGTFNLTAANLTIGNTGLFGNTVVLDTRNINVTNSTNIQPGSKLFMLGGHFSSGAGITNNGEIIVNSPFTANFTNPIINNGEIRVATGATANFSGNVTGIGSFTGGGAKVFKSPSNSSVGAIDSTGSTVVEAGATLAADRIREQSLTVNGNVNINPGGTDASTSRLNQLSVTGRLDLSNNALVLDYTGPSPINTIRSLITSGFAGGSWNGTGINSSVAASAPNRALGFAEATDIGSPAVFAGQAIDATTVLIRFTLPGDANLDRSVNISDFSLLAANFNQSSTWFRGDFNYDGVTNIGDFALLAANFNLSLPADLPRGSAIPEPAGTALLLLAAMLNRPRRRGAPASSVIAPADPGSGTPRSSAGRGGIGPRFIASNCAN